MASKTITNVDADMSNSLQLPPIPVSVLGLSNVKVTKVEIDQANQLIFIVVSMKTDILYHYCGMLI